MASKRSFFNPTLLRKNLLRFWPCWAGTLLLAILILPVGMADQLSYRLERGREITAEYISSLVLSYDIVIVVLLSAMALGLVVAALLSRYLYTARSANFFHSLPIRREGLLLTNVVSGLVMLWAPMVFTAIVTAVVELAFGAFEPVSLLQLLLMYLCASLLFFGMAMVCMHLTGMLLAGIGLYAVLNVAAIGAYSVVTWLLSLFVVGFTASTGSLPLVRFLTPVWNLVLSCDPRMITYEPYAITMEVDRVNTMMRLDGLGLCGIYALVGVGLLALTLSIARRRQSERAGDLIAFGWLRPVFKVACAVFGGALLGIFTVQVYNLPGSFWSVLPVLLAWSLVAWLVAEMLVRKSLRVFRKDIFLRWGITAVCITLALFVMQLDLFGLERRIPDAEDVESVTVSGFGRSAVMDDPTLAIELHEVLVEHRNELRGEPDNYSNVHISYLLTSGNYMERNYRVPAAESREQMTEPQQALYDFVTTPEVTLALAFEYRITDPAQLDSVNVEYNTGEDHVYQTLELTKSQAWQIYQALEQDMLAGNFDYGYMVSQDDYDKPSDYIWQVSLNLRYAIRESEYLGYHWFVCDLTDEMTHTVECLLALGLPAEARVERAP